MLGLVGVVSVYHDWVRKANLIFQFLSQCGCLHSETEPCLRCTSMYFGHQATNDQQNVMLQWISYTEAGQEGIQVPQHTRARSPRRYGKTAWKPFAQHNPRIPCTALSHMQVLARRRSVFNFPEWFCASTTSFELNVSCSIYSGNVSHPCHLVM